MVSRDDIIARVVRHQYALENTTSIAVAESTLTAGLLKRLNEGKGRMDIIEWLERQKNLLGPDVRQAVVNVADLLKDGDR